MLKIWRDLAEGNEFVAFAIGRVANPGLHPALHVHRGCRRVDPPASQKDQHAMKPEKDEKRQQDDAEPQKKESKETRSGRRLCRCGSNLGHVPTIIAGLPLASPWGSHETYLARQ
jgi:hypothetical protein